MTLFWQHFRAQRGGLLIWLGTTMVLVLGVTSSAGAATQQAGLMAEMAAKLPPALRVLWGYVPGMNPVDSFILIKLGVLIAVVLPIYACLLAMGVVTREVDRRTADFLLALPVDRERLVLARWAVMAVDVALVALAVWATLVAGLKTAGLTGSFGGYFWMLAEAWLLGVAIGSLALLASIWIDDYSFGVKVSLAGVGVLYVLDITMRVAELSRWARFFNPYTYVDLTQPILTGHPAWGDTVVLLLAVAAATGLAARAFARKQIQA